MKDMINQIELLRHAGVGVSFFLFVDNRSLTGRSLQMTKFFRTDQIWWIYGQKEGPPLALIAAVCTFWLSAVAEIFI